VINAPTVGQEITFENVTILLNPRNGSTGDSLVVTGPSTQILLTNGQSSCDAASYESDTNTFEVETNLGHPNMTFFAAASIIAPFNLAGYSAVM
jgi:hypothetical protein